jgi:hypothetical protein
VAPSVIQTNPLANDINVSVATTINVTFNEPVIGVDTSSFTVNAAGAVTGTVVSANGGRTWVFTPAASLPAATLVTVMLTTAVTDASANPLFGGGYVFTFTTQ